MLLIYDEIDYMGSKEITNTLNIRNEAPDRIKVIAASTPSGKREEYYTWCKDASLTLRPKKEDIDNFQFTGYIKEEAKEKGNGWVQIYAPSTVNKEIIKLNPDTGQTYLEDIKDELSDIRYVQEVMAEFGEEEFGVYKKDYIDRARDRGRDESLKYLCDMTSVELQMFMQKRRINPLILAVDWDLVQNTPSLVGVEFDRLHRNEDGVLDPVFKIVIREEIPRTEFTMDGAVNRIIELNDMYNFDWIAADRGFGDVQIEMLKKYGTLNPETGLHTKVIGYQLGQKLEVLDPHTKKKEKKNLKPFMVNNSVLVFERNKILLHPDDKLMTRQLENYRVKSVSTYGVPTYTDTDEHSVDALNLCLLAFEQKYGEMFNQAIKGKVVGIDHQLMEYPGVKSRDLEKKSEEHPSAMFFSGKGKILDVTGVKKSTRNMFTRRSF